MKTTIDKAAKNFGFLDREEMNRLIASIDLSTQEKVVAFKLWQKSDGTRDGLVRLLKV